MARKGARRHLKRLAAPRNWRIPRGRYSWAVRPHCGPHPINTSMPLLNLVKLVLAPSYTAREARHVLFQGKVLIDGVKRSDYKFPVGLMDVVSVPATDRVYRILPLPVRGLTLHPIAKTEAGFKLCRVISKVSTRGGNLQINLHDGRNILVKKDEANKELSSVKTHDTLKIEVPSQKIIETVKYEQGTLVLISGGKNVSMIGRVEKIHEPKGANLSTDVSLRISEEKTIEVPRDYTFAIGKEESLISYPKPEEQQDKQ
ncbi:MAG: 30S ribosomal protein S4e [Promethearchaeati archaeon SRVP18_Atabeyarchaeia-1]